MNDQSQHGTAPTGHEPIEANVRAVWITGAVLTGIVAATFLIILGLQARLETMHQPQDTQTSGEDQTETDADWNVSPQAQELRAKEQRFLTTYEWVDQTTGVARIPLDRALELIAENGLPETISGTANPATQNTTE
jgi:hypothetical protein